MYHSVNYLIYPNFEELPFPEKLKEFIKTINWENKKWSCIGLNETFLFTYSIIDKFLYLENDGKNKISIKKLENYSGYISIGLFLTNPNKEENNYAVSFSFLIDQGKVIKTTLLKFEEHSHEKFNNLTAMIDKEIIKVNKLKNSFIFKNLYLPYRFIINIMFDILLTLLSVSYKSLVYILKTLTPY